jgi:hypothetical protein
MENNPVEYEVDKRKDPTPGRRGNFKQGWTRAVNGQEYEGVLTELKWNNLGWRLGKIFDETPDEMRDQMFEWCVEQRDQTD